jgi:hypothetical protein
LFRNSNYIANIPTDGTYHFHARNENNIFLLIAQATSDPKFEDYGFTPKVNEYLIKVDAQLYRYVVHQGRLVSRNIECYWCPSGSGSIPIPSSFGGLTDTPAQTLWSTLNRQLNRWSVPVLDWKDWNWVKARDNCGSPMRFWGAQVMALEQCRPDDYEAYILANAFNFTPGNGKGDNWQGVQYQSQTLGYL